MKKMTMKCVGVGLLGMALFASLMAADVHVDNVKGTVDGPGSKEAPFKTIAKALKILKSGDTLHLTPNEDVPYEEVIDTHATNARWGGTAENPTVIDGHGATITGLRHFEAAAWKAEGDGVFSRPLGNNAWNMDKQGHWNGHSVVFFDDKPAEFRKDKASLIDFTYFLHKDDSKSRTELHNTLYIKLPADKTPDDVKVVTVGTRTNLYINRSYITVKNLKSIYAGDDAFATGKGSKGLVFDNIQGSYCMDQGISNHGAEAIIKNSTFDHNTISGIVDVYLETKVKYLNCTIENNGRGGVEFYSGEFSMENCTIRNNIGTGITVNRMAKASILNCYIQAKEKKFRGIHFGDGSLTIKNCTIYNASEALTSYMTKSPEVFELTNCAFINNRQNLKVGKAESVDPSNIKFKQNIYTPANFSAFGTNYAANKWGQYQKTTGFDSDSLFQNYEGSLPPLKIDMKIGDTNAGSDLK
jgi:hypothetical protein